MNVKIILGFRNANRSSSSSLWDKVYKVSTNIKAFKIKTDRLLKSVKFHDPS